MAQSTTICLGLGSGLVNEGWPTVQRSTGAGRPGLWVRSFRRLRQGQTGRQHGGCCRRHAQGEVGELLDVELQAELAHEEVHDAQLVQLGGDFRAVQLRQGLQHLQGSQAWGYYTSGVVQRRAKIIPVCKGSDSYNIF